MTAAEEDLLDRAAAGAEACRSLADELTRQAESMLRLADRLERKSVRLGLVSSGLLAGPERARDDGEERPVMGRRGVTVTVDQALHAAETLTRGVEAGFTRADFVEATSLSPVQATRMLERLAASGSVARVLEDGAPTARFRYVEIAASAPANRPNSAEEVDAGAGVGADAPARGKQAAHTRLRGRSASSLRNKQRQAKGVRVKGTNKKTN